MTHWTLLLYAAGQMKHRYERKLQSKGYLSFFDHCTNGDNQTIWGFVARNYQIFLSFILQELIKHFQVWSQYYDLTGGSAEKILGVKGDDRWWIMDVSQLLLDPHTTFSPQKWTWNLGKKVNCRDIFILFFFFLSDIFHHRIKHVKFVNYYNWLFSAF